MADISEMGSGAQEYPLLTGAGVTGVIRSQTEQSVVKISV